MNFPQKILQIYKKNFLNSASDILAGFLLILVSYFLVILVFGYFNFFLNEISSLFYYFNYFLISFISDLVG